MTAHKSTAASVLSRRALLLTVGAPKTPSMRCFASYTVQIRIEGSRIPLRSSRGFGVQTLSNTPRRPRQDSVPERRPGGDRDVGVARRSAPSGVGQQTRRVASAWQLRPGARHRSRWRQGSPRSEGYCGRLRESSSPPSWPAALRRRTPAGAAARTDPANRTRHSLRPWPPPLRSRSRSREGRCSDSCARRTAFRLHPTRPRAGCRPTMAISSSSGKARLPEGKPEHQRLGHGVDVRCRARWPAPLPGCCDSDGCGVHSPQRLRWAAPKRARSALAALKTAAPSSSDDDRRHGPGDPDRLGREFQRCCGQQQSGTHRHGQGNRVMGQPGKGTRQRPLPPARPRTPRPRQGQRRFHRSSAASRLSDRCAD